LEDPRYNKPKKPQFTFGTLVCFSWSEHSMPALFDLLLVVQNGHTQLQQRLFLHGFQSDGQLCSSVGSSIKLAKQDGMSISRQNSWRFRKDLHLALMAGFIF
jgi:hypothetical protein